jgi:outer membrane receptor protein involved in Fe transport
VPLKEITVVAERAPVGVPYAVAGVSTIDAARLPRLWSWPEALAAIPGIVVPYSFGSGSPPIVIARGFQGGGETDYVLMTVDGLPVNDPRTGAVQWQTLDTRAIRRIEVLKGGGSALYGDAAVGATVNALTHIGEPKHASMVGSLGSSAQWAVATSLQQAIANGVASLDGLARSTGGMRTHAAASMGNLRAGFGLTGAPPAAKASAYYTILSQDEPGPLPLAEALAHPEHADDLFRADHRKAQEAGATASVTTAIHPRWVLTASSQLRREWEDQVRTIPVTPSFGDTQREQHQSWDLTLISGIRTSAAQPGVAIGAEVHHTSWSSSYHDPDDQTLLQKGDGRRLSLSGSMEMSTQLSSDVRILGGLRYDYIWLTEGGDVAASSFSRLSPRIGLNLRYSAAEAWAGTGYLLWSQSFKAPTVAQLFDGRTIRAGPGEPISFENPSLHPQMVNGIEAGMTQKIGGDVTLTIAGYRTIVNNEIDFDVATFRYGNIASSSHRGLESSVTANIAGAVLQQAASFISVTSRIGANQGKSLKNIPSLSLATSLGFNIGRSITANVAHRLQGRIYLNDENTVRLEPHATLDVGATWLRGPTTVTASMTNVLDRRQPSLGFLLFDPATGAEAPYAYPGDARQVTVTIEVRP